MTDYKFIFILLCTNLFLSCGSDENSKDDIPPQAPIFVARTADNAYPQQGIRPEPVQLDRNYNVRIEWYRNPEDDVAGYVIRRFPEWSNPGDGYSVADLRYGEHLFGGTEHAFVDQGYNESGQPAFLLAPDLETGDSRGYFWTMYAYDEAGNHSAWSDTLYYRLIQNPTSLSVARLGPDEYLLGWNYTGPEFLSYYKFRVYSAHYGQDSVIWDYQIQRYGTSESVLLGEDGHLGQMQTDCTYVWQLNAVLIQEPDSIHQDSLAGSSVFTTFIYQN